MADPAPATRSDPRIRLAVTDAVRQWRRRDAAPARMRSLRAPVTRPATAEATREDVLRPLPRRRSIIAASRIDVQPPHVSSVAFEAGLFFSLKRLGVWLWLVAYLVSGRMRDRIAGRDGIERRARRLRDGLERVGGTFVKLGQQIAMRIDMVPWEYCIELSKMLDRMRPFAFTQALAAIERAAGRPWQQVYQVIDPEPVGAASIACVYQALLHDGTKVAIKVRRPGIGETFMADFRVLDWLFGLVEWLAIVRPGLTVNLRREFRETLLEELDFRKEGRFQHIFRRNARKTGEGFFTAPEVHFGLSNDEVLVQEFVSGMWLWELIATVEQGDQEGRDMMRHLNIDPALVARRILRAAFWSMNDNLFFHADPHPANIVVGPDSTLTFIDFGSCGSFNREQNWTSLRLSRAMASDDPEGMARATMKLIEPFPPLDIAALMREAQTEYERVLYTFRTKAKHTEWWERTTASLWMAMVKVFQKYNLPFNLHTLRMIRATLLYDTLATRLDRDVDRFKVLASYTKYSGRLARRRWRQRVRDTRRQLAIGLGGLNDTADDLLERAQQLVSLPVAHFTSLIDKGVFAATVFTRMMGRVLALTGLATGAVALASYLRTGTAGLPAALTTVMQSDAFRLALVVIVLLNVRHILIRFRDSDVGD